jgi:hypothetical protein
MLGGEVPRWAVRRFRLAWRGKSMAIVFVGIDLNTILVSMNRMVARQK